MRQGTRSTQLPIGAAFRPACGWGLASLAAGLLLGLPALVQPAWGAEAICTATAKAVRTACRSEVQDDYWITVGNCGNISERDGRKDCLKEAKATRNEAKAFCGEQFGARREVCSAIGEGVYEPEVTPVVIGGNTLPLFIPENFPEDPFQTIDTANLYFPLLPGAQWTYKGTNPSGEVLETIVVTVEEEVKNIGGVNCVTFRDVVREGDDIDGPIIEDTDDWYAQDLDGNVWYCGEIAQNFELFEEDPDPQVELVDVEGSWKGFRDFAKPGILMLASPQVGDVYRQEIALGNAEDAAEIVSVTDTVESVPAADCSQGCVVVKEFTPIEPDALGFKYYAQGFGTILEVDPESGHRVELISFTGP
jgi:hypothetical protein